jgi:TatA/E family protein of Tat protein translocase
MEIVVVLVLALLVFGPKRLPQAGRSLGQAMREFRKAAQTARTELGLDEVTKGINDLKSSVSVDTGLGDIKSAMSVDLKAATATAAAAPPADKPVPVASAGSDTVPAEAPADAPPQSPLTPPAEPAVDEPAAAEVAADEAAGRDEA